MLDVSVNLFKLSRKGLESEGSKIILMLEMTTKKSPGKGELS